jgi:hypothetical protein
VGSSSNSSPTDRRLTLARPAGTQPGQTMVASVVASADGPGFTAPAGWTVVRDDAVPGALRQTIYLKVAGPDEPASYTWNLPWPGRVAGGLTAYAGVDPTQPVDAVGATSRADAGTDVAAPPVSTTTPGALLVHFAALNAEGTISAPAGMTQRWLAVAPWGDRRDALAASSDTTLPAAGLTGPRTAPATEPGPRIGVLLALRPAP